MENAICNLELQVLTKIYSAKKATKKALAGVSFTLGPGLYGLLGPNGAGKSTMMNIITGNLDATSGKVLWNGKNVLRMGREFRRVLGYMPQQQNLYDSFTGRRFLLYIAALKEIPRSDAALQVQRVAELVHLSSELEKRLAAYSGGMKQRVLLAQALLGQPGLLLLDEPTAGLDPKERIRIRNFISSVSRDRITLLATHIVSDIESISDQILLMKKGKLLGMGTPEQLLESVADKVKEMPCPVEKLEAVQKQYLVGNVFQRQGETWVRIIGDDLPDEGSFVQDRVSLEDVYLYYLGE